MMLTMQSVTCASKWWQDSFRRYKEAGSGLNQDRSRALWYVLCKREMVRRYAYKLQAQSRQESRLLRSIEAMEADGTFDVLPKKEVIQIKKEMGEASRRTLAVSRK